jgi:glycosyltransferase involved in cell wall biosynthesis
MAKRIVINGLSARRGGGKTYLYNLLKFLPHKHKNNEILLLLPSSFSLGADALFPSLKIKQVNVDNPVYRIFFELIWIPLLLRKLCPAVYFSPGGLLLGKTSGSWKSVTMFRNMIPFDIVERKKYPIGYMRLRNWLLSKLLRRSIEKADLTIFISNFALSVIEALDSMRLKEAVVIPHGVSDDFRNDRIDDSPSDPFLPDKKYIFYPSIIDVYKSQYEIVEAVAILKRRGVEIPQLLFAGEVYGPYGAGLHEKISALGLSSDVLIHPPIPYEQMPAFYNRAEFVLFGSKSENCPNILLEALASGCAIACSNVMPMPEFGKDAVVYFNPADPQDIARVIQDLIEDPPKIEQLGYKSAALAKEYSWNKAATETWDTLFK